MQVYRVNMTTAAQIFNFCETQIKEIDFVLIKSEDVNVLRANMKDRLSFAKNVPGSRSFHLITPISSKFIAAKQVSEDLEYAINFDFKLITTDELPIQLARFIVCMYDDKHWLGMVMQII